MSEVPAGPWLIPVVPYYSCASFFYCYFFFQILYPPLCAVVCGVQCFVFAPGHWLCCFPHLTAGHFPFEASRSTTARCSSPRARFVALSQRQSVIPVQLDSTWKTPGSSPHETTCLSSASAPPYVPKLLLFDTGLLYKMFGSLFYFFNLFCIDCLSRAASICRVVVVRGKAIHWIFWVIFFSDDKKGKVLTSK